MEMRSHCAFLRLVIQFVLFETAASKECDCNCCESGYRQDSMQINGVKLMCGNAPPDSHFYCGEECQREPTDEILESSFTRTVSLERFCFYSCEPMSEMADADADADTGAAKVANQKAGEQCQELSTKEEEEAETAGGNAEDLAELKQKKRGPVDLLDPDPEKAAQAAVEEVEPEEGETPADVEEEKEYMQIVADAQGKEAQASAVEARSADAEVKTKRNRMMAATAATEAVNAAKIDFPAVATLSGFELQSKKWAHISAKSADLAAVDLQAIRAAARQAAMEAAKAATAEMQAIADEASKKAAALKAKFNPPKPKTAEAANKVVAPYNAAMGRAMGIRAQYSEQAQSLSNGAADLQKNARILAAQAAAYRAGNWLPGNNAKMADEMMSRAKGMLGQAASMDAEAQQFQSVAASITQQIPDYQFAAAAAAARATALANPAGQPPPPLPMLAQLRRSRHRQSA
jgi:SWI/SNF-related matrix-associated actin-dependent regulator 1 of chromatin subfamily A